MDDDCIAKEDGGVNPFTEGVYCDSGTPAAIIADRGINFMMMIVIIVVYQ